MTQLVRHALKNILSAHGETAHPGLLLQRGYPEGNGDETKTEHIARVCACRPDAYYRNAYARWRKTTEGLRFCSVELALRSRMFTGLAGGGMVETGCAISHSYGMPYIPGSSVKGVVSAYARDRLGGGGEGDEGKHACDEIFGAPATAQRPEGLAGLISFHHAWWVPDSADDHPFVQEVVTSHHLHYYGTDGKDPATDFDSPVPNAQVAVQGSFQFVLEGEPGWLPLARRMLIAALSEQGIGAKTRAGYGLFDAEPQSPQSPRCPWVDQEIARLASEHKSDDKEMLRGKPLANAWAALEDPDLKAEALDDIRSRWKKEGWWESPPGRASRQSKAIYEAG